MNFKLFLFTEEKDFNYTCKYSNKYVFHKLDLIDSIYIWWITKLNQDHRTTILQLNTVILITKNQDQEVSKYLPKVFYEVSKKKKKKKKVGKYKIA